MTSPESSRSARDVRRLALSTDGSTAGEFPVAQRVARMLRDLQDARARQAPGEGGDRPSRAGADAAEPPLVRLLPPERSLSQVARERVAWEEIPGSAEPVAPKAASRQGRNGATGGRRASRTRVTRRSSGRRAPPSGDEERPAPPIQPRTDRPEIPEGARLSAAEIQALIRAGRGVRTVAEIAEAPVDWVRYLAEPVFAERSAVLSRVLTARPRRPRAKGPGDPLGRALLLALRARKVPAPEQVLANGFTAYRRGHEPWRVRLSFTQNGRRLSALWAYDPRTHSVEPRNRLADELGWRRVSPRR